MNPMVGELKNPFTNAKVIGANIRYDQYSAQTVAVGEPGFSMSFGQLMEFQRCPHRWLMGYESEETRQTEWGSIIDCLALTPARWKEDFAVCPETYPDAKTGEQKPWNWNANFCKAWREERKGVQLVKAETAMQAQNAVKILYGKPSTREFLECSDRQVMVVGEYHDQETGLIVPIRCLIDLVPKMGTPMWQSCLGDLKTANSAGMGWRRKVFEFNYHVQAALYVDLYEAATHEGRSDWVHIVQESYAPWEPARKCLSAEFVELGRWKYRDALARYAQCLKNREWPGYDEEIVQPEPWMLQ